MTLVGVYVFSPDKVGHDAGEFCGLEPRGVLASQDIEDIVELGRIACCTCRGSAMSMMCADCWSLVEYRDDPR